MEQRQSIRRPLGVLTGFLVTVLVANAAISSVGWTLLNPVVQPTRSLALYAWYNRPEVEDVLLIGSSRVMGGFDARLMQTRLRERVEPSATVYKLGLAGLRPLALSRILEDGIALRPPRKLLVIAIEPRFFARPALPPGSGPARIPRGEWELDRVNAPLGDLFFGVESLWQLDWVLSDEVQDTSKLWASRGGEFLTVRERRAEEAVVARARVRKGNPDRFDSISHGFDWTPAGGPDAVGYARAMEIIATLPCDVLFIHMPLEAGFREEITPVVTQRFFDEIVADVTERGYPFVDLNGPRWPQQKRFFLTRTHLNVLGCDRTSLLLTDRFLVPNLRGD